MATQSTAKNAKYSKSAATLNEITIQKCKQKQLNLPLKEKLNKLSYFSACQTMLCHCTGWEPSQTNQIRCNDVNLKGQCGNTFCRHSLKMHIQHLEQLSTAHINELLNAAFDLRILHASVERTANDLMKRVYSYVYRLIREYILTFEPLVLQGPFGRPPFETPCIAKIVLSFVYLKYSHLSSGAFGTKIDVACAFLKILNRYILEPPSNEAASVNEGYALSYKVNYIRWQLFCHVPFYCNSMHDYEVSQIFGRNFFVMIFYNAYAKITRQYLLQNTNSLINKPMIIRELPVFLNALRAELLKENSPIWDHSYYSSTMFMDVEYPTLSNQQQIDQNNQLVLEDGQQEVDSSHLSEPQQKNNQMDVFCSEKKSQQKRLKTEQQEHKLELYVLENSSQSPKNKLQMLWLVGCELIFSHQLPLMPTAHMTQLLFDRQHKTLALLKEGHPIGGICFRTYIDLGFTEIVFFAITTSEQTKGYGTYLMDNLKSYSLDSGISHFLTYADCKAIEFFKKHGFSEDINLAKSVYAGCIEQYAGAILMHCNLMQAH